MKSTEFIRVKVMSKESARILSRQLPGSRHVWGECHFLFDPDERDYDWLVVYNELPGRYRDGRVRQGEALACASAHTLLVTSEPSSIKSYGSDYVRQFGCVLTSQEDWALAHPDRIYAQPALHWFYGVGADRVLDYDQLDAMESPAKDRDVAMVWSAKKERYTFHSNRYKFMQRIRAALPGLDVYGRGVRALDDKAEALDRYRYHIAIENHIGLHHWTEKLADPFLGFTLPFYCGCPNAVDYFPAESFIPIDINDFDHACATIVTAIENNEYEKRQGALLEARRRVLEEYNFFSVVAREVARRHDPGRARDNRIMYSRRGLRNQFPLKAMRQVYEKTRARALSAIRGIQ